MLRRGFLLCQFLSSTRSAPTIVCFWQFVIEKENAMRANKSRRTWIVVMRINITARLLMLFCLFSYATAYAADNPLLGTWRLKSFVREVAGTTERYNQLGDHPDGYINYDADGRMFVFCVSDEQPRPRAEPTDDERIKLHKTMLAYGGTYTWAPGKVVHHIDIEWDGRRLGTDQVRFYTIEGDKLVIKTEPNKSPVDGREGVGNLTFERVKPS